jgi:predicted metal-dependent hydrolase
MKSSPNRKREFIFGSYVYHYDLVMQDRKSLSLTVTPDLQICLKCPHKADDDRIEIFLKRKWFWLEKQLSFFRKYQRKIYQKEYISGEGFLYLGKQYKLLVKRASEDKVSMTKGLLLVQTTKSVQDGKHTKKLVDKWYRDRIEKVFTDRFDEMKLKFDYKKMPDLAIREMQKRWGSFLENGKVVLNPKLIHTSKDCIDYVIVHELCHVKYKNHNKFFYTFLKKKYPKWEKVKDKLETIGVQTS